MVESSGFWSNDPSGKHGERFWDGRSWTAHVSDLGFTALDPLPSNGVTYLPPQLHRLAAPGAVAPLSPNEPSSPFEVASPAPALRHRVMGVPGHALVSVVTAGLWLLVLPAVLLWRRGSRPLAAGWAVALTILGIAAIAAGWGPQPGPQPVAAAGSLELAPTASAAGLATMAAPTPITADGADGGAGRGQAAQDPAVEGRATWQPGAASTQAPSTASQGTRAALAPNAAPVPPDSSAVAGAGTATTGTATTEAATTEAATTEAATTEAATTEAAAMGTATSPATSGHPAPNVTATASPGASTTTAAGSSSTGTGTAGYPDCGALTVAFPHGVARSGAVDVTAGTPVTTFTVDDGAYLANQTHDVDSDGIACERS